VNNRPTRHCNGLARIFLCLHSYKQLCLFFTAPSSHRPLIDRSSNPAVAMSKRAKPAESKPSGFWSVIITHFEDDYKVRGSDWSHCNGPHHFSTRQKAEDYLCGELVTWMYDRDPEKLAEEHPKFWAKDDLLIKPKYLQSLPGLEEAMGDLSGEFVPCLLNWDIQEVVLDEHAVPHLAPSPEPAAANASDTSSSEDEDAPRVEATPKRRKLRSSPSSSSK
jgi:hypothetical protein